MLYLDPHASTRPLPQPRGPSQFDAKHASMARADSNSILQPVLRTNEDAYNTPKIALVTELLLSDSVRLRGYVGL
jgi:hypothetical protein